LDWIKIEININPQCLEDLSPAFFALGAEGVEEKGEFIIVYFDNKNWYNGTEEKIFNMIKDKFPRLKNIKIEVVGIPTEAWNEKWKENFKPFKITDELMIYPDWEVVPDNSEMDIITISPKMAFGTGHHETTSLILEIMPKYLKKDMSILDAGTGSGILAIYAVLKGAANVTAYDFDPVATENCIENISLNNVENKITVITGELEDTPQKKYDMILANINKNVLIGMAETISNYMIDNGVLILSGLLGEDSEQMVSLYEKQWKLIEHRAKNEWITLVFKLK
jgi:ribosomal protein L11 methyltransferase